LSSIHDLLDELLGTFAAHRPPRRVSPSQLAALQGRLDQELTLAIRMSSANGGKPVKLPLNPKAQTL
jgi:hypothetical protein